MKNFNSPQILSLAVAVTLVIMAVSGSIYWIFFRAPVETADQGVKVAADTGDAAIGFLRKGKNLLKETAGDIKEGLNLNGRITVNGSVVFAGNRDITELAIKEKRFTYTYSWTHDWAGSTKKLEVKGEFRGKAGYDLNGKWTDSENFWGIDISEADKAITARIPEPSVLSVEMTNYKIVKDEDGHWNRISKEDRQRAVNALQQGARIEIEETGILEEVDETFLKQIEEAARETAPSDFKIIREDPTET